MIERESKEAAEQIIIGLFPDPSVRVVCMRFLAASISLANSCSTGCWGVTIFDGALRLNVGRIEVLTFGQSEDHHLHLVIDSMTLPESLSVHEAVMLSDSPLYRSVPSSIGCDFPAQLASTILPFIALSHEALIRLAASTPLNPSAKAAYSPGLVEFLSTAETPLSHPAYFSDVAPVLRSELIDTHGGDSVIHPDEIARSSKHLEGAVSQVTVNRFERERKARNQCVQHHGCICSACGFDFEMVYGERGAGFIHVHHLKPLSEIAKEYEVDPIGDLRPLCPNCHAMIHRGPEMGIEELKELIRIQRRDRSDQSCPQ